MSWRRDSERLSKAVVEKIGGFLFGTKEHKDSDVLDISTDIETSKELQAFFFYRTLGKTFRCQEANDVCDTLERLAISKGRESRKEGVLSMIGGKYPSGEKVIQTLDTLKREIIET